ncbi:D-inositol-3-phosphate glycosyltransferase [subsurface metagenome]
MGEFNKKVFSLRSLKPTYTTGRQDKSIKPQKPLILHFITNVNIGGAERTLLRTIKHFDRDKFNHIVLTLLAKGSLWEQFKKEGIEIQSLNMKNHLDIFSLIRYIQVLRVKKPAIVVAYLFHALTFAVIGKVLYPRSILVHYKRNVTFASRLRDKLNKLYTFFVDYLIGISKGVVASESKVKFHLGLNSFFVYNGIELPKIHKRPTSKVKTIIGTIARLHYQKGLTYLLEAAKDLKNKKLKIKFIIIGGGEQYSDLKRIIDESRLKDTVELKGEKINAENYLKMFDIFILPSIYEGFGNVFIEAMSYKIPVIGTNVSGINEIIKNNINGLLIKPKSPKAITEAIIKLIEDPGLRERLGREGRKTVKKNFIIQKTVNELESIFSKILAKQRNFRLTKGIWERII